MRNNSEERKSGTWRIACLCILLLSAGVYGAALRGLPIWEDHRLIDEGSKTLLQCFTTPFLKAYFRPLVSAAFSLDFRLSGEEPFMYHQTNIALHVLTTALFMGALRVAFASRRVALVGGLLFAVQPAQVSAVAWIGGRTDSLCALWVALFAWSLINGAQAIGKKRAPWLGLSVAAYVLALLTKEQAVALLPLAPLAFYCFTPGAQTQAKGMVWKAALPFVIATLVYLFLWRAIGSTTALQSASHPLAYKVGLCGRTITYYALLLFLPTPRWMHSFTVISLQEGGGILSAASGYVLLGVAAALFRRWLLVAPAAAWFLALAFLSLLPVSNAIPVGSLMVAPFRASVAGLGSAALLAWIIVCPLRRLQFAPHETETVSPRAGRTLPAALRWGLGAVFAVWCLGLTLWGARQWSDPLQIHATFARYDPRSLYIGESRITTLMQAHQPRLAQQHAEGLLSWLYGSEEWRDPAKAVQAFARDPQMEARIHSSNGDKRPPRVALSDLFILLGYTRMDGKRMDAALQAMQTASAIAPDNASADLALGQWYTANRDWRNAITYLQKAAATNPRVPMIWLMMGSSYGALGQWKEAVTAYQGAARAQPWDGGTYLAMAEAQVKAGDTAGAQATLQQALTHEVTHEQDIRQKLAALQSPPKPKQ